MHNVTHRHCFKFPLVIITDSERCILIFNFNHWQDYSCCTLLFKLFFITVRNFLVPETKQKKKKMRYEVSGHVFFQWIFYSSIHRAMPTFSEKG